MHSNSLCRTCETTTIDNLVELTSYTEKFPTKMLWDMLFELANIGPNINLDDKLPQHLCGICFQKLKSAYGFVIQARHTNDKLIANVSRQVYQDKRITTELDTCQETPIILCPEEYVDVKFKEENFDISDSFIKEGSNDCNYTGSQKESSKILDPLTMIETLKFETISKNDAKVLDSMANLISDDELDDLPLHQRKLRKQGKCLTTNKRLKKKKGFKCDECSKTFIKKSNLNTHKRGHSIKNGSKENILVKVTAKLSESKQAKCVDVNLCKPHGCKLIQCMICLRKYSKFSELHNHLQDHPRIDSFNMRTLSEVADSFYPDFKNVNESELIERIQKDLKAGKFSNFYSITNQSGYELSLDSSETESDLDPDSEKSLPKASQRLKYTCEICRVKCCRKYQLLEHQRQEHTWQEAQYVCARCDARFVNLSILAHHYKSQCKNSEKRFKCRKCPLRFRWKHNFNTHYRDHRKKFQELECLECHRRYEDKKSLTIHMLTIHSDESKLMPCDWCNRKFYRRDYLIKHLKRHGIKEKDIPLAETYIAASSKPNGIKNILCKVCGMQFENITELRGHILMELKLDLTLHHNYDSLLNYSITNESGFEMHIDDSDTDEESTFHSKKKNRYTCELCQVQCSRKYEIFQHQRSMHRFENLPHACDTCIFKSVSRDILEHHRLYQCLNKQKQNVCLKCGYKYMWPENLQIHMRIQHKEISNQSANQASEEKSKSDEFVTTTTGKQSALTVEQLQCPHCDRTYVQQSRLNNHIRDVHIDGDRKRKEAAERKYLCSLCGTETRSASNLVTHMRRHTGEKPFKCDMCDMAFPRHTEMLSHRRKHTGEKPYHCTVCGKDFARSDKLKRHMLTHSGLKPYKCTFCEKCYRQSKDLKLHMQQHTGETLFECGVCGERFIESSVLEKHRMMRGHFDKLQ